jgi:hypothetical protein
VKFYLVTCPKSIDVIFCRATIHPILTRLGVDTLVGRMARLREDERFKAVGPENVVLPYPVSSYLQPGLKPESDDEGEIWFDWAFVDFWKSNYCQLFLQRENNFLLISSVPQIQYKEGYQLILTSCRLLQVCTLGFFSVQS